MKHGNYGEDLLRQNNHQVPEAKRDYDQAQPGPGDKLGDRGEQGREREHTGCSRMSVKIPINIHVFLYLHRSLCIVSVVKYKTKFCCDKGVT